MSNQNEKQTIPDKETQKAIQQTDSAIKLLQSQLKQAGEALGQRFSIGSALLLGVSKTKEALTELVELDSILTDISKTSGFTSSQLEELGNTAFDSASKYGKSAKDYLINIREMSHAGFDNAKEMAELSLLAQASGDLDASSANSYLRAADAAYNLKGSLKDLQSLLDSQTYLAGSSAVRMQDMADATTQAASAAAQYDVEIDELSALIAAAASKTGASGNEIGRSLAAVFSALQDTGSPSVANALASVGISMTKLSDGSRQLKTPIELLEELSAAFTALPEGDSRRSNLLSSIGNGSSSDTLSAILSDWGAYESMLNLYPQGMGSAAKAAEKSADSMEGSLTRLSNTWTDTVGNIGDSDILRTGINLLNGLLGTINHITEALGPLMSIGLGAGLFAGVKNIGKPLRVQGFQNKPSVNCFEYAPYDGELFINARSV